MQTKLVCFLLFCFSCFTFAEVTHDAEFGARVRYGVLQEADVDGKTGSLLLRASLESTWENDSPYSVKTFIQADHVETTFDDEFSTGPRLNGKPVFPDPAGSEINQLSVRFASDTNQLTLGRQVINLDDQRFIGAGSYWQNEQSFDAIRFDRHVWTSSQWVYAYIANANRIFGNDAKQQTFYDENGNVVGKSPASFMGDHKQNTHIVNLQFNEWDYRQWVVYAYLVENEDLSLWSSDTFGTRFSFRYQTGKLKTRVEVEAARQRRPEVDTRPEMNYAKAFVAAGIHSFELSGRYEYLGEVPGVGFVAALGSPHEFQGWADVFAPMQGRNGLTQHSLRMNWRRSPWKFDIQYLEFHSHSGELLGSEIDVDIAWHFKEKHLLHLRFADFNDAPGQVFPANDESNLTLSYEYNL